VSLFGSKSHPNVRRRFVERRIVQPIQAFMATETAGGVVIVVAALIALAWANSPWQDQYFDFWHTHLAFDLHFVEIDASLGHLVNDGLMVVFFFVVGLEIKRELVHGELASPRRAALPVLAAAGGMAAPALIYIAFNGVSGEQGKGWGVPVATDIAFAVGVLALLGNRVPFGLRVFLLALAIADDLGGILVIAVFYTESISLTAVGWGMVVLVAILLARSYDIRTYNVYVALGVLLWLCVYESGVHATIAGVMLAMLTPAKPLYTRDEFDAIAPLLVQEAEAAKDHGEDEAILRRMEELARESESPLDRLTHMLHPWVGYAIVPIFALANAGVVISSESLEAAASSTVTAGVVLGLVLGKPIGITLLAYLAVRSGMASLPTGVGWGQIFGAGILGGVGFTVALFITELAFTEEVLIDDAKMGILAASFVAGVAGFLYLRFVAASSTHDTHTLQAPALSGERD